MGILHFQDRLTKIDMVLEIRDARIPFSSANPELEKLVRHKRRLLVLNKADLAAPDKQQVWIFQALTAHSQMFCFAVLCLYTCIIASCGTDVCVYDSMFLQLTGMYKHDVLSLAIQQCHRLPLQGSASNHLSLQGRNHKVDRLSGAGCAA